MTPISDKDRTIFSEVSKTVLEFSVEDGRRISELAAELMAILDRAKGKIRERRK